MAEWHELVVEGTERTLRAFVAGFLAGRGEHAGAFSAATSRSRRGRSASACGALRGGSHHVFLAPVPLAVPLAQALGERGRELGLAVERRRLVESARFSFRAEAFSREVAAQIRGALLTALPAGVRVEQRSEKEESHPEAHGPEPFAPLHEYIYRVSGDIVGPLEGVLEVWQRARTLEFVEAGSLHLEGKILSV